MGLIMFTGDPPISEHGHKHLLVLDCPDCGRVIAYRGCCGKCGGRSWLPAGYVNRAVLRSLREERETLREEKEANLAESEEYPLDTAS